MVRKPSRGCAVKAIHFISGLPRSGSTLLAALLRQNPRFQAGMSGPLAGLFGALLDEMSGRNEFSVFIDDAKRERILRGLFNDFYADCTAEVIFDTNRGWCAWMPAIARLFPDAKVIACVRELQWVVDSIERLIQHNVFSPSSIFNYSAGGTVFSRATSVVAPDGMVGGPYDALRQACYGAQRDRLLLLQYETLSTDPAKAMQAIYAFLGEPVFEHDFGHVEYDVTEFDERAGTPGLHTVRPTVTAEARDTLLPPDLFNRFTHDAFWRDPERIPAGLTVV
ncbi:Sulfotransferase domain protein [Mycobacterium marinum]|uniref:Sulfotransferase domain protein n=1 Tax=Mycobacterium marinum TaxID=1781 RepID=A0A3E2N2W5_MYCMR|nr:Sulfotransferase domain protein [Mycobacterium marinum]AXN50586.1 Sulfotransferase domain protein [Mycobacterium marinum]RFZ03589.1 Sulfotransferase domain protein [Mycobacterium marinum]RFZ05538.1 Sulfotransferase domain protein [Mycobacterium marinum]RFZ14074.1 Sulfotransferase domain protein [Mycobacterium marinum]